MASDSGGDDNLFSKVLNGMKTAFNGAIALKARSPPSPSSPTPPAPPTPPPPSPPSPPTPPPPEKPRIVLKFRSEKPGLHEIVKKDAEGERERPQSRPSRRIKPTAKVLANREAQSTTRPRRTRRELRELREAEKPREASPEPKRPEPEERPEAEPTPIAEEVEADPDAEERRRIDRLKKKHLKKLGLKAVAGSEKRRVARDPVTDDSTMDSTNTEAIVEHLSARARERSTEEVEPSDGDRASVRLTRKRSRISNACENEARKPSASERGARKRIARCLCDVESEIYADPKSLSEVEFCRAVEYVGGKTVGCGRPISFHRLIRSSVQSPFFLSCDMHHRRLSSHHCCASCGVFCSQGAHFQCDKGHFFHLECGLPFNSQYIPFSQFDEGSTETKTPLTDLYPSKPGCPHCGVDEDTSEPINFDCTKVTLDMKCSDPLILLPNPRLQWMPARMSFPKPMESESNHIGNPEIAVIPKDILNNIKNSIENISCKRSNGVDYDLLLMKVNRDNQKDMNLIKAVCEKENTIENIVEAINLGGDPKKRIPHVDNGTFLHLAARELNLSALHIFRSLGCELDTLDVEQRTPLMLAVMNYDTEIVDKPTYNRDEECNENGEMNENGFLNEINSTNQENVVKELVGHQNEYRLVINYLLKAGSDVSIKGPNGATVLHLASKYGDIVTCSTILETYSQFAKSFVNQKDDGGWTPLVWAVENKRRDVVKFLLENGADVMIKDFENNIALHWAAMTGCNLIMEDLLNHGSQVNLANTNGDTPLHLSARHNNYKCVVILLARGAQIEIKNCENEAPIDCIDEGSDCYSALYVNEQLQKIVNESQRTEKIISSDLSNGKENNPIRCVNSVDDETLEGKFSYVTKNCFTLDVNIDRKITSMQTCQCRDQCGLGEVDCACANLSMRCWYDNNGRLVPNFDYDDPPMIFECNDACSCNKLKCVNRCLDDGSRVLLKIFRQTDTSIRGGGWGVCSMQSISKGTLISEYVGEILPGNLAFLRTDDSYLFELELKDNILEDKAAPYCIDAKNYGNVSRFFNHKCEPNLIPIRVFVDHRDLRFPRIAFFANRDIAVGEELGFDYGSKFWNIKIKSFTCNCNSSLCRYDKPDNVNSEEDVSESEEAERN